MKIRVLFASLGLFILSTTFAAAAGKNVRMWTDAEGKALEMQMIKVEGDHVIMRTRDLKRHRFPLTRLAPEDQAIARQMTPLEETDEGNRSARDSAAWIDRLIEERLAAGGGAPNEMTTDEQFVRRIYLDVAGRIPSFEEADTFVKDENPDKRAVLINELLDSDAYKSHMFNYMGDMLRLRDRLSSNANYLPGQPYITWVKEQIEGNTPYHKMVYEMLTATGKVWESPEISDDGLDHRASGYLLRDSGMPLDSLANTTSIFLGTEIACAQCHDHPFYDEHWTQMKFYKMASYFGSTVTQLGTNDFENGNPRERLEDAVRTELAKQGVSVPKKGEEIEEGGDRTFYRAMQQLGNMVQANRYVIREIDENRTKLPNDYKYSDGEPGEEVKPGVIEWPDVRNVKISSGGEYTDRQKFALWLTSKDNPMFAKVIANRLWSRAFGLGIAEPIDNLFDPAANANPKLLEYIASEMVRVNFDLKEFQRTLYNTKSYQRQVEEDDWEPGTEFSFAGPRLTRMTAEQMWDSYMTLVLGTPDEYKGDDGGLVSRALDMDLDTIDGKTAIQKLTAYQQRNQTANSMMMGGDEMEGGKKAVKKMGRYTLLRASEMQQPASPDHFLAEFGQSDRRLFDGSSKEGSVPQILRMLNGSATGMITGNDSRILDLIGDVEEESDKIDRLFMSVLSRKPTLEEAEMAKAELAENSERNGFGNLIWALVNTREFLFIQ